MFVKRLLDKAFHDPHQHNAQQGGRTSAEMDVQIAVHYGVPYTSSILAFDPIQRLLAIGTLDGRVKIIGGDNIEGLLISPKKVAFKYLEFLQNQGVLVAISNENEIQVWNLEFRQVFYCSQWEANITAFAVIQGTCLMYVGDDNGLFSVLKYDIDDGKLKKMPYHININALAEMAGIPSLDDPQSIVGILPQPCTFGTRVLIAYEKGALVLWDISEDRVVIMRGHGDLQLKGGEVSVDAENENEETEICSLCWASTTGSTVAVGYMTGDILLWNLSSKSAVKGKQAGMSGNVVKLQLASGSRRLPVIVLHWTASTKIDNDKAGHLLIYGGDEIGSEEVLTVLDLEYSTGLETVKCTSRMNLSLNGSFADMILVPDVGVPEKSQTAALFVLTNPGQLNVYGGDLFSVQKTEDGKAYYTQAQKFPAVVSTIDPDITATTLCVLSAGSASHKVSLKKFYARKNMTPPLAEGTKWPLSGGVPSEMSFSEDYGVERMFIAGYQDGSVKIWDATFPVLMLMFVLEGKLQVPGTKIEGDSAPVSVLAFCSITMTLAVGNEYGLVRIYKLHENTEGSSFHFVTESKQEVHIVRHGKGFHCNMVFMVLNSPVRALQYAKSGERLAVGFQSGQVAMLDVSQLSVLFCVDCTSGTNSPLVSLRINVVPESTTSVDSLQKVSPTSPKHHGDVIISLTKDAYVTLIDSTTGTIIISQPLRQKQQSSAFSMYVIDGSSAVSGTSGENETLVDKNTDGGEPPQNDDLDGNKTERVDERCSNDGPDPPDASSDPLLLICCEDALLLFSLKSIIQGGAKHLHKVKLAKVCCWSSPFRKIAEKACEQLVIYQTGDIEIRSLPELEIVGESSLMSTLRWSFKTNMDKTLSSLDGQITLVNGSEFAIISPLAAENDFRIPESLPCLHDKVVAAAAEAAISVSKIQKKKQDTGPGIIGDIIKGFKGGRPGNNATIADSVTRPHTVQQLEELFAKVPFGEQPNANDVDPEDEEPFGEQSNANDVDPEDEELSIDDIEIDDVPPALTPIDSIKRDKRIEKEREKLFEGSSDVVKPRVRTTQEILTKYKFGGDATAAAAHARDKLAQRQEKLERLSQRTAELESGAQDFASMASELAKAMENKKWWKP